VADAPEGLEQEVDDLARGPAAAGSDEADAAGVALGVPVVEQSVVAVR
jgi:hypothetical protein